jgi:hypothetical protein
MSSTDTQGERVISGREIPGREIPDARIDAPPDWDPPVQPPSPPRPSARLRVAVEEATGICGPGWCAEGEQRVAAALGPALYARARAAPGLCDDIAEVALRLADLSLDGDRATERVLTGRMLERLRHPGTTKLVVRSFAAQTVPAPSTSTVVLVNALRSLGVLHCVLHERGLAHCRCLWPLTRHEHDRTIRNDVRMVVRFGLTRVPAQWMVVAG